MMNSCNMEMEYMSQVAGIHLLSFFALFMVVGVLMRTAVCNLTVSTGTFKHHVEDIVTAFEVYGCNIGHIYVFQIYGLATHLIIVITVGIYHALFLKGCSANPVTHVLRYLTSCCPLEATITRISAQVLGGVVGHITAVVLWPLLMSEFDQETLEEMHCVAASNLVPAIICLAVEFLGMVLICILVFNIASSSVDFFEPPVKVLLTCLLNGTGVFVSNIYLNPVVASSRLIGCGGKDVFLHLSIYWTAPIGGAAVAVVHKQFTTCDDDLACLPSRKCQTSAHVQSSQACIGLKSDRDPNLPCVHNAFCQPARPCTPLLTIQMPPIFVSRAEEAEDDSSDDEVIYNCAKDSDVGKVDATNYDGWAHRRPQCTEQPFDDTCFREFPGSNTARSMCPVTLSKTYATHNAAPVSRAGKIQHTNRLRLGDLWPVSDETPADDCCEYTAFSCSNLGLAALRPVSTGSQHQSSTGCKTNARKPTLGEEENTINAQWLAAPSQSQEPSASPVPSQSGYNKSPDQSDTSSGVPNFVGPSPGTDTQGLAKTTVDNYFNAPPTYKRSQHALITQSFPDNSQNQRTDSNYGDERQRTDSNYGDERAAKASIPNQQAVPSHHQSLHPLNERPSHHESTHQDPKTSSHQSSRLQVPKTTVEPASIHHLLKSPPYHVPNSYQEPHHSPTNSNPTPSHSDPRKSTPQGSTGLHATSHQGPTDTSPPPSQNDPLESTPQSSIDNPTTASTQGQTDTHPTPLPNGPNKPTPQDSTGTHTEPSDQGPTDNHSTPSHNDASKSTPQGSTHTPSHHRP